VNVTGANLAVRLEAVVGAAQVDGERDSCEKYAVDGVVPGAIAKPSCAAEIVELVRFAKTEGLGVVPVAIAQSLASGCLLRATTWRSMRAGSTRLPITIRAI